MSNNLILGQAFNDAIQNGYSVAVTNNYSETPYPFRPVQCVENDIKVLDATNNFLYFTTDTKKIYLGKNNKFLPMCASSGIFYGTKKIYYDNSGETPSPDVDFSFSLEIEGDEIPEVDDLILNGEGDGCFYRVLSIIGDTVSTKRLTLRGGGGGGSSEGGEAQGKPHYSLGIITTNPTYSSEADKMPFKFKANYAGTAEDYITKVSIHRGSQELGTFETTPFYEIEQVFEMNKENEINLIECKEFFTTIKSAYTLVTHDLYDTERSVAFNAALLDLKLTTEKDLLLYNIDEDTYEYACVLSGGSEKNVTREIVCDVYLESDLSNIIYTQSLSVQPAESEITFSLNTKALKGHGVYVLKFYALAKLPTSTKPLASNVLTHKLAHYESDKNTPLLLVYLPENKEQYLPVSVDYCIVYPNSARTYDFILSVNGRPEKTLSIEANTLKQYELYFEKEGRYTVSGVIEDLNLRYEEVFDVAKYSGNIPIINSQHADLMLYLDPRGKSNDEDERHLWKNKGKDVCSAQLSDMHYGMFDGWLTESDNTPYLKLASGAKLHLPDFHPFAYDLTQPNASFPRAGEGFTIELDFQLDGVLNFESEIIKWVSTNVNGVRFVGFTVTGNKVQLYNKNANGQGDNPALIAHSILEGKRIRLSFVVEKQKTNYPMAYVYVDGVLSGAVIYGDEAADNTSELFKDSKDNQAELRIDSTDASVKIYSIRLYSRALNHQTIVNNYIASLSSLADREIAYDSNNIFDNKKIDYKAIAKVDYDLQIPYMTITGGYKTVGDDDKYRLLDQTSANIGKNNNPGLPTGKKDFRLVDIEIKYPNAEKYPRFAGYKNYSYKNTFKTDAPMAQQFGQKPSNGGTIMYAQGTSSMEYPVKNLRLRCKNKDFYYNVRPDIEDVEIICMKADYMESAGAHNTGTANFVDDFYTKMKMATPGQKHFNPNTDDENEKTIVTCIKGHPCLIFYRANEDDDYEFIGKYNLNLDKATPKPFGFGHDGSDFGYLAPEEEYYKITYYDEKDETAPHFIGQADPDEGGDYLPNQVEELAIVKEGEKINSIHCFEFLDNAIEVCNFMNKARGYLVNEKGEIVLDDDGMPIPDPKQGYYTYEETWYNTFMNKDGDSVPGWTLGFESRYPKDRVGYHDADMLYPLASWINELYSIKTGNAENEPNPKLANARFKNEYKCYLDEKFTVAYYLITEALLMADSRVKNMMIATWGKSQSSYYPLKLENNNWVPDESKEPIVTNYYKFYPIFYDMDTMLGLDNTGADRFKYYEDDSNEAIYNGKEVLWNFVKDNLSSEIRSMFNDAETTSALTEETILTYIGDQQANLPNAAMYNGDADYKYTGPAREGYYDYLNKKEIAPGAGPYLYAAQGNRDLMRTNWVNNRMRFLRGKRESNNFYSGDRIEFRWYYPTQSDSNPNLVESIKRVAPDGNFDLTALQVGYAGVMLGANAGDSKIVQKFGDGNPLTQTLTIMNSSGANGTEAYILGASNLSSFGDLSNKYMQKFILPGNSKIKQLILGNSNRYYCNPYWRMSVNGQDPKIQLDAPYLQYFNLFNCSDYVRGLSFIPCKGIETILLTGSGVNELKLPPNGILKELRLPTSLFSLEIDSHPGLEEFSWGTYDYDAANSDIIENNDYYKNDYTNVTNIKVKNTPIIDTHEIIKQATAIEDFNLPDVNWKINDNYTVNFKTMVNGEEVSHSYTMVEGEGENATIVCIPAVEKLIKRAYIKDDNKSSHAEFLQGTITVDVAAKVDEYAIYEKYFEYFPNLDIQYGPKVKKSSAYVVNFYTQDKDAYVTGLQPYVSYKHNGSWTWSKIKGLGINPLKSSTDQYDYQFAQKWYDIDNRIEYDLGESSSILNTSLPTKNINGESQTVFNFVPIYDPIERLYSIIFYNDDGTPLTDLMKGQEIKLNYNNKLSLKERLKDFPLDFYYKEYDGLNPHGRYTLEGWITKMDYDNGVDDPTLQDLDAIFVTNKDFKFVAKYKEEDASKVPSLATLFRYEPYENYYSISVNDSYRKILRGKITLPAQYNGKNIIHVHDFTDMPFVSHIYFEPDNAYIKIGDTNSGNSEAIGFGKTTAEAQQNKEYLLEAVYLPTSITTIGDYTFFNQTSLKTINFDELVNVTYIGTQALSLNSSIYDGRTMQIACSKLPDGLTHLGQNAFYNGGPNITFTALPNGLTVILPWTFARCPNLAISVFGIDETGEENIGLKTIGNAAFSNAATATNITDIYIKSSVKNIAVKTATPPFRSYGSTDGNITAHLARNPSDGYYDYDGVTEVVITAQNLGVSSIAAPETVEEVY